MNNYDVIVITETWLHEGIKDSEILDDRYIVYRSDRDVVLSGKSKGGGVFIAVHKSLTSTMVSSVADAREEVSVKIKCSDGKSIFLCAVYIPPNSEVKVYKHHVKSVEKNINSYGADKLLILGDYNLPNINWFNFADVIVDNNRSDFNFNSYGSNLSQEAAIVLDSFSYLGLNQVNNLKNNVGNTLDLVFTSIYDMEVSTSLPFVNCDIYHPSIVLSFSFKNIKETDGNFGYFYDFKSADYNCINKCLANVDWTSITEFNDINEVLNKFYEILWLIVDILVPKKKIINKNYPKWFNSYIIKLIKEKKKAHKAFKVSNCNEDYIKFNNLRKLIKIEICIAYESYINTVEHNIVNSTKYFWDYVHSKTDNIRTVPNYMYLDNKDEIVSGEEIADLFASYFQSMYKPRLVLDPINIKLTKQFSFNSICISEDELLKHLLNVDVNKGPGPDGIPPLLIKSCASVLVSPLLSIFNMSLDRSHVPDLWKKSFVVPVYKKGDKEMIRNYRPVSIQSCIPKILDKIFTVKLKPFIENIVMEEQHGFISSRSTVTNLFIYTDFITKSLEAGNIVDAIYTDFNKAFDTVNQERLIYKLKCYGVGDPILSWLSSFLSDRIQIIKVNKFLSREIKVTSGVPQGSHMGPLLFLAFINDIKQVIKVRFLCFADDLKLFNIIQCHQDGKDLQDSINNIYVWCDSNGMSLNLSKCKCLRFSKKKNNITSPSYFINNSILEVVQHITDLGVIVDSQLTFHNHINNILCRAFKILGFIKRMSSSFTTIRAVVILYLSLVRSVLEYGSIIWAPYFCDANSRLERVQKKLVKYLCFKTNIDYYMNSYKSLLQYFGLCDLAIRRRYFDMCFVHKIVNSKTKSTELHNAFKNLNKFYPTRTLYFLQPEYHRTCYGFFSPLSRCIRYANMLCSEVDFHEKNYNIFKRKLRLALSM